MATRTVTISITLDDADNEILEIVAGVQGATPDAVLADICAPLQAHLKRTLAELRRATEIARPAAKAAFIARSVAAEVMGKLMKKR
jgi:hypothetical protein